jgi:uncharacterized protein (TIGR02996 family)
VARATESEFRAAIRRAPTDRQAVQVFADWLLDRGDARGELLVLQEREDELGVDQLERLLVLSAEHGFMVLPDDPEADVLRFAGGSRHGERGVYIEYSLRYWSRVWTVTETRDKLVIDVDGREARSDAPHGMIRPEAATAVLSALSRAIHNGTALQSFALPVPGEGNVGRFPTEPIPDQLAARHRDGVARHIDLRDLARWRRLFARWRAAS